MKRLALLVVAFVLAFSMTVFAAEKAAAPANSEPTKVSEPAKADDTKVEKKAVKKVKKAKKAKKAAKKAEEAAPADAPAK
jgi:hypothetical protein